MCLRKIELNRKRTNVGNSFFFLNQFYFYKSKLKKIKQKNAWFFSTFNRNEAMIHDHDKNRSYNWDVFTSIKLKKKKISLYNVKNPLCVICLYCGGHWPLCEENIYKMCICIYLYHCACVHTVQTYLRLHIHRNTNKYLQYKFYCR